MGLMSFCNNILKILARMPNAGELLSNAGEVYFHYNFFCLQSNDIANF